VVINNPQAKKVIVCLGDYNAQPPQKDEKPDVRKANTLKGIEEYFYQGYQEALKHARAGYTIEIIHDMGHIKDTPGIGSACKERIKALEKEQQEKAAALEINVQYLNDHYKNPNTEGSVATISNKTQAHKSEDENT